MSYLDQTTLRSVLKLEITPENIEALGKAVVAIIAAIGTIVSTVVGFYSWKTRYELDKLYTYTYRKNEDGSPGPMRNHPEVLKNLVARKEKVKK